LRIGDRPGVLAFVQPDGGIVPITAFQGLTGQPLVLIFLRHLA
jgi:hypothetical protein